ncbi:MAG TPA: DHA2 family efflux MFS transporter permease subunit [Solirubrobacterales bacterium]|nr:DHA2 family efflux MFS transporter permease subunit [Solirubrobacterales bacterium]
MSRLHAITEENRKWWTLGSMCFALFMIMLDNTVVNVALPSIQSDLNASLSALEWTVNVYTLTFAVLLVTGGRLGDIFGRRRAFMFGVIVFAVSSATAGLAPNESWLVASRALQGVGAAFMMPATLSIITNAFPAHERGKAIGTWAGVSALALAIGPVVGGFLTEEVSWRAIFFLNLPVAALAVFVALFATRESRDVTVPRTVDFGGVATLTVGIGALVLALVEGNGWGWGSPRILALLFASAAGLVAFVIVERRVRFPMVEFSFLRSRTFAGTTAIAFVVSFSMLAMFFFMALYMQNILGYSPLEAGIRFLPSTVMIIIAAPIAGRLTDRIGARIPIAVGLTLVATGLLLQSLIDSGSTYSYLLPSFILTGLGIGLTMSPMSTAAMNAVDTAKAGLASGVLSMSRMVGGTFGVAAVGALFQHMSDNRLEGRLGDLPLSSQQQAWFADNLGSGDVPAKLQQLDPTTAREVSALLKDSFVHSLSASLKLSTAVAVVGVLIALATLRDARHQSRGTVPASVAPVARRPD